MYFQLSPAQKVFTPDPGWQVPIVSFNLTTSFFNVRPRNCGFMLALIALAMEVPCEKFA